MIIVLKPGTTREQVAEFSAMLESRNDVKVNAWYGEHSIVLGLLGDTATVDSEFIGAQKIVESVKRVQEPYKKANRKFHPDDTVIDLGHGSVIGGGKLGIIAGSSPAPPPTRFRVCVPAGWSCFATRGKKPACLL